MEQVVQMEYVQMVSLVRLITLVTIWIPATTQHGSFNLYLLLPPQRLFPAQLLRDVNSLLTSSTALL